MGLLAKLGLKKISNQSTEIPEKRYKPITQAYREIYFGMDQKSIADIVGVDNKIRVGEYGSYITTLADHEFYIKDEYWHGRLYRLWMTSETFQSSIQSDAVDLYNLIYELMKEKYGDPTAQSFGIGITDGHQVQWKSNEKCITVRIVKNNDIFKGYSVQCVLDSVQLIEMYEAELEAEEQDQKDKARAESADF